ncbi:MAG: hypothetical protein IJJ23_02465 [Clostridia bacterium]|nr:hypothetical protein [Clostridia bacterium]
MKKRAAKGLLILAIVVALCMFFSGTIRTITTPKVKFISAKQGKFESTTDMTAKVTFPETEEIKSDTPEDVTISIKGIFVKPGQKVKAGEKLFSATVVDYEKTRASLQSDYAAAETALRTLNRKNGSVHLNRNEQAWADAYYALDEASQVRRDCRIDVLTLLALEGFDAAAEELPEKAPKGASKQLKEAYDALEEAESVYAEREKAFNALARYAIEENTWTYLQQVREYEQKMAKCENEMTALNTMSRYAASINAPHTGYIAEVTVEKGQTASGGAVLLKMTPEDIKPVLRIDVTDVRESVSKGTVVKVPSNYWGKLETTVQSVGTTSSAGKYADAKLTNDIVDAFGSVNNMMQNDVTVQLVTKAKEATCLVSASAVRGSGDDRYVYCAEQESSTFGGTQLRVRKMGITVLNESPTVISVAEDLTRLQIIYMEDRALSEGDAVMPYEG